jgi:isochorismate hydrolase
MTGQIDRQIDKAATLNPAYAEPEEASLPASDMRLDPQRVALVVIDPQNDFLHEKGVAWGVVGKSVIEHNAVQHLEDLFKAANRTHRTHHRRSP